MLLHSVELYQSLSAVKFSAASGRLWRSILSPASLSSGFLWVRRKPKWKTLFTATGSGLRIVCRRSLPGSNAQVRSQEGDEVRRGLLAGQSARGGLTAHRWLGREAGEGHAAHRVRPDHRSRAAVVAEDDGPALRSELAIACVQPERQAPVRRWCVAVDVAAAAHVLV